MLAFGHVRTRWPIEITIVAPNNDDYLTNLDTYCQWREQIRGLFQPPFSSPILPTTPGVFDLDVEPGVFLDRDEIKDLYDYMTVKVWVSTVT